MVAGFDAHRHVSAALFAVHAQKGRARHYNAGGVIAHINGARRTLSGARLWPRAT
jgi:hypothetical protein